MYIDMQICIYWYGK